jgi:hypothetical protein
MRFEIPPDLVAKLRTLQSEESVNDPILKSEDAVVLSYGLGPALYLTFDGRIIVHPYMDDLPPYEATDPNEAHCSIVVGANTRHLPELLALLPPRPPDAIDCARCTATGWMNFGLDIKGKPIKIVCAGCNGLGWLERSEQIVGREAR